MNVLAALAVAVAAPCSDGVRYQATNDLVRLDQAIELYVDPARDADFAEVSNPSNCSRFDAARAPVRLGANGGRAWLRFGLDLPSERTTAWQLLVEQPPLTRICVYWPIPPQGYQTDCQGQGSAQPLHWDHGYRFTLPSILDDARPVYLAAQTESWLGIPMLIGSESRIAHATATHDIQFALYFGLLGAFILVGLVFAVTTRRATYAWFSLFYGCYALMLAGFRGLLADLGLPLWTASMLPQCLVAAHLLFGTLLFSQVLQLPQKLPGAAKLFWTTTIASIVITPLIWIDLSAWTFWIATIALLWFCMAIGTSGIAAIRGQRFALWSLGTLALYVSGSVALAFNLAGLTNWSWTHIEWVQRSGAALSMFLLMFGAARHMRQQQKRDDLKAQITTTHRDIVLHHASRDTASGLPNRASLHVRLSDRLQQAFGTTSKPAVAIIGLAGLRELRHARGHHLGNEVLYEVGRALQKELLPEEELGSMGSDAVILLSECRGHDDATISARVQLLADQIRAVAERFQANGLTVHIGLARYPDRGTDAEQLLTHAEIAMHRAHAEHVDWLWFNASWMEAARQRLDLLDDLRTALNEEQLSVHFQPIIDTATDRTVGCEALLRWTRADGQAVSPAIFVPLAENHGLIDQLTDYVLKSACAQIARWKPLSHAPDWVAVNLSARQLHSARIVQRVGEQLAHHNLSGECLHLEITESAIVSDIDIARRVLTDLRALQASIAVDDFGVGFSSLSQLRTLPIDTLKIDRSFIRGVPNDAEAGSVIKAIIHLGTELGLEIVAEGVESPQQYAQLREWRCTRAQGFLFSPAMDAQTFDTWAQLAVRRAQSAPLTEGVTVPA